MWWNLLNADPILPGNYFLLIW